MITPLARPREPLYVGTMENAAKVSTSYRSGPRAPGVFRPGPRCEDNSHLEVFGNAGDWDRPEWRRNGHPDVLVRQAYMTGWAEAIAAGAALEFAHERAEQAAALYVRERGA